MKSLVFLSLLSLRMITGVTIDKEIVVPFVVVAKGAKLIHTPHGNIATDSILVKTASGEIRAIHPSELQ